MCQVRSSLKITAKAQFSTIKRWEMPISQVSKEQNSNTCANEVTMLLMERYITYTCKVRVRGKLSVIPNSYSQLFSISLFSGSCCGAQLPLNSFCSPGWPRTQGLFPPPPECWVYRLELRHPVLIDFCQALASTAKSQLPGYDDMCFLRYPL